MAGRRRGSNRVATIAAAIIVLYGIGSIYVGHDLLADIPKVWLVGMTAIVFGLLLVLWALSDFEFRGKPLDFVGGDTVSMVVGIIVALVIISEFARGIANNGNSPPIGHNSATHSH